jgi:hypothetical protein
MKQVFLILCILFVFFTITNAEEIYTCTDSTGNTLITSIPQDGMKCVVRDDNKEPSRPKKSYSKDGLTPCDDLSHDLSDTNDQIQSLEQRISELKKEQLDIRQESLASNWSRKRESNELKPLNDKQYKLNKELSILYQKRSLINNDIKLYKCNEMKNDLLKLNQQKNDINRNNRYEESVTVRKIIRY